MYSLLRTKSKIRRPKSPPSSHQSYERLEQRNLLADVSGNITTDTVWDLAEGYTIVGDITIDSNVSLTIAPGVEVQSVEGARLDTGFRGTLIVDGAKFVGEFNQIHATALSTLNFQNGAEFSGLSVTVGGSTTASIDNTTFRSGQVLIDRDMTISNTSFESLEPLSIPDSMLDSIANGGNSFVEQSIVDVSFSTLTEDFELKSFGNVSRFRTGALDIRSTFTIEPALEVFLNRVDITGTLIANDVTISGGTAFVVVKQSGNFELTDSTIDGQSFFFIDTSTGNVTGNVFNQGTVYLESETNSVTVDNNSLLDQVAFRAAPEGLEALADNTFAEDSMAEIFGTVNSNLNIRVMGNLSHYRINSPAFSVPAGVTLDVGQGVQIGPERFSNIQISGVLNMDGVRSDTSTLTRYIVTPGGQFNVTDSALSGADMSFASTATGTIVNSTISIGGTLSIVSEVNSPIRFSDNNLFIGRQVTASGDIAAPIDMKNNYWRTESEAAINNQIVDMNDSPDRPLVEFIPFRTTPIPIHLSGTTNDDTIEISFSTFSVLVKINDQTTELNRVLVGEISIDALGGKDSVKISTSELDDTVVFEDRHTTISNEASLINILNAEMLEASSDPADDEAGFDRVFFYGTDQDELFLRDEVITQMTGGNFQFSATGFDSVRTVGGGGEDQANVTLSESNATFISRDKTGTILGGSGAFSFSGFEETKVEAIEGGDNRAILWGTDFDDSFEFGRPANSATLVSPDPLVDPNVTVTNFSIVVARGSDGNDSATFWDTPADEVFYTRPGSAFFSTETKTVASAFDFENHMAFSSSGSDRAFHLGSSESLRFNSSHLDTELIDGNSTIATDGFSNVTAVAGGTESSSAFFNGSTQTETFSVLPGYAGIIGENYRRQVRGFDNVTANAGGGLDEAFLNDTSGNDRLTASPLGTKLEAVDGSATFEAIGFPAVYVNASLGEDTARFSDSISNDRFTAKPNFGFMSGPTFSNLAIGFDYNLATSSVGGQDVARLIGSSGNENLFMSAEQTTLRDDAVRMSAQGFQTTLVDGGGGSDTAYFTDTSGNDFLIGEGDELRMFVPNVYLRQIWNFQTVFAGSVNGGTDRFRLAGAINFDLDAYGNWIS